MEERLAFINTLVTDIREYVCDGGLKRLYTRDRTHLYKQIIATLMKHEFDTRPFENGVIPELFANQTIDIVTRWETQRSFNMAYERLKKAVKAADLLQQMGYSTKALAEQCQVDIDNDAFQAAVSLRTEKQLDEYRRRLACEDTRATALSDTLEDDA